MRCFILFGFVLIGIVVVTQSAAATPPPPYFPDARTEPATTPTAQASNQFAFDILRELTRGRREGNLVFSPWSISTALAMALEGAQGQTALEMGRVLRLPAELRQDGNRPWKLDPYHAGFAALQRSLQPNTAADQAVRGQIAALRQELQVLNGRLRQGGFNVTPQTQAMSQRAGQLASAINQLQQQIDQFELSMANSVWVDQSQAVERTYTSQLARFYGTGWLQRADFVNQFPAERQRINRWVEMQTRDRIKELIPNVDGSMLRMILVNAIYFKGEWSTPFEADATKPEPFYTADGRQVPRPSMYRRFSVGYAGFQADGAYFDTPQLVDPNGKEPRYPRDDGFLVAELPYKGDKLAMVVIAPRSPRGLAALEAKLSAVNLANWLGKLQQRDCYVTIPRFKVESSLANLENTLAQLGMTQAFDKSRANFFGIHRAAGVYDNLYISRVLHKAFIEVNEKGSEAAAATAVMMPAPGAAPPFAVRLEPFIPEFRADRLFLFLIRDMKSGTVLFMGRVTLPGG